MKLTVDEVDMLRGKQGKAKQKAMEFLLRYGEALGAEQFADTNNVTLCICPEMESLRRITPALDMDEYISKDSLFSDETLVIDKLKAFTTSNATYRDYAYPELQKGGKDACDAAYIGEKYCQRIGIVTLNSCVPYQCGNIPTKGEHCAWTESSAIAYCNSIIGAKTNIEGSHSAFASAITGKTPLAGLHLDENRKGTIIVQVDIEMDDVLNWGLLGYYAGLQAGLEIPVYTNIKNIPDLFMLMSLGAAGMSSGTIALFHIPGITPEAATLDMATGNGKNISVISYGREERKKTHEIFNRSAKDDVDVVVLGCPHYSLERIAAVAGLLEGKKVHESVELYITVGRMQKAIADRAGYSGIIKNAGGVLLEDSCGTHLDIDPSKSTASDSAKMLHYLPRMTGVHDTFLGTLKECVTAAIMGKWTGRAL
jgi:predicted aconitase